MSSSSAPLRPQKSSSHTSTPSNAVTIRARGRSFLALVLSPEAPLTSWLQGLDAQMLHSVGFFSRQPIILDLGLLKPDTPHLDQLQNEFKERGIRLIGIEGAHQDWPALKNWDWPTQLNGGRPCGAVSLPQEPESQLHTSSNLKEPVIVNGPVRSGQAVQNPDGDVIILGPVSSGAEIIAGGSIHVYGPLRGRAIAGVDGRPQARIYTLRMEAELLAIDGYYMISEEIDSSWLSQAAQALLENNTIVVKPLQ